MPDLDFWGWVSWVGHALSPVAIIGAALGYFPAIASGVAIIFYVMEIYEKPTVQTWLQTRRLKKITKLKKEIAALEAAEMIAVARRDELKKE